MIIMSGPITQTATLTRINVQDKYCIASELGQLLDSAKAQLPVDRMHVCQGLVFLGLLGF